MTAEVETGALRRVSELTQRLNARHKDMNGKQAKCLFHGTSQSRKQCHADVHTCNEAIEAKKRLASERIAHVSEVLVWQMFWFPATTERLKD